MSFHDEQDEMLVEQRLPCGRSTDDLMDQVAAGRGAERDEHQQHCVHCQAALGEYERLWGPMEELAAEEVTAPEGKFDSVMRRLRGAFSEPNYAVLPGPLGATRIAARVIVVTASRSAQAVEGVRVALSKVGDEGDDVTVGVAGSSTAIEIVLAASYGEDLHDLAERVRREVTEQIHELTGLTAAEVSVVIDDVLD
ncbi:Asp23/Gls24 family envelope stress response protein [Pseudonocardia phyllosphaerae]|uniref:Asp23/Gls24 family envelope stress response protein n=1 Tax=Pseudonocardia phyllosphaerae TaxID=3390502 RepID=UPI00397C06E5